jgi:Hikeshi-like, C-terminal domain/Hikeshi-like, N-terminal domain
MASPGPVSSPAQQRPSGPPPGPLFALLVPGRPIVNKFNQAGPKRFTLDIPHPAHIKEFGVSLIAPAIPQDHGVGVYFSVPPFKDMEYVGKIDLDVPSAILRAPWFGHVNDNLQVIRLGLSVEPLAELNTKTGLDSKEEENTLDLAEGIGKNLYQFMASFAQNSGQFKHLGDVLVIPTNCVDRWFKKFKHKHMMNPYFWLKKGTK